MLCGVAKILCLNSLVEKEHVPPTEAIIQETVPILYPPWIYCVTFSEI
jgi:hypothetical protein